jgi:hypothetical protein
VPQCASLPSGPGGEGGQDEPLFPVAAMGLHSSLFSSLPYPLLPSRSYLSDPQAQAGMIAMEAISHGGCLPRHSGWIPLTCPMLWVARQSLGGQVRSTPHLTDPRP